MPIPIPTLSPLPTPSLQPHLVQHEAVGRVPAVCLQVRHQRVDGHHAQQQCHHHKGLDARKVDAEACTGSVLGIMCLHFFI